MRGFPGFMKPQAAPSAPSMPAPRPSMPAVSLPTPARMPALPPLAVTRPNTVAIVMRNLQSALEPGVDSPPPTPQAFPGFVSRSFHQLPQYQPSASSDQQLHHLAQLLQKGLAQAPASERRRLERTPETHPKAPFQQPAQAAKTPPRGAASRAGKKPRGPGAARPQATRAPHQAQAPKAQAPKTQTPPALKPQAMKPQNLAPKTDHPQAHKPQAQKPPIQVKAPPIKLPQAPQLAAPQPAVAPKPAAKAETAPAKAPTLPNQPPLMEKAPEVRALPVEARPAPGTQAAPEAAPAKALESKVLDRKAVPSEAAPVSSPARPEKSPTPVAQSLPAQETPKSLAAAAPDRNAPKQPPLERLEVKAPSTLSEVQRQQIQPLPTPTLKDPVALAQQCGLSYSSQFGQGQGGGQQGRQQQHQEQPDPEEEEDCDDTFEGGSAAGSGHGRGHAMGGPRPGMQWWHFTGQPGPSDLHLEMDWLAGTEATETVLAFSSELREVSPKPLPQRSSTEVIENLPNSYRVSAAEGRSQGEFTDCPPRHQHQQWTRDGSTRGQEQTTSEEALPAPAPTPEPWPPGCALLTLQWLQSDARFIAYRVFLTNCATVSVSAAVCRLRDFAPVPSGAYRVLAA